MKKLIIFSLSLLFFFRSQAQVDSATLNAGPITLQARDAEFLAAFISSDDVLANFLDGLKTKFRMAAAPTGTTNVTIDNVSAGSLLYLASVIRHFPDNLPSDAFTRIDAAIRACQNAYLQSRLVALDAYENKQYDEKRKQGRKKLRGTLD